jgi:hypothetical protein
MKLTNVKATTEGQSKDRLLVKCYIISLFYPEIPKPISMPHGVQGAAKTMFHKMKKKLVDPGIPLTLTFPRDKNELIQKLSHNYVAYFDNVSIIKPWISDELCRGVSGGGFSKRELYTDDDDIIYDFKRCIGFNGINLAATKQDLIDRGLIIEFERIPPENKREEKEIWAEFEAIRPQLLGYILDILVKVLQKERDGGIKLDKLPRMADFAITAELISRCMGNKDNEFVDAFNENIQVQVAESISANLVASAIVKFMEDLGDKAKREYDTECCSLLWFGTATILLTELERVADELKINTNQKSWPKGPSALSRRINEVKVNLLEVNIKVEKCFLDKEGKVRGMKICKIPPETKYRRKDENRAQNGGLSSGDINGIPPDDKIPPEKTSENRAQIDASGGTGGTGGIIHTSTEPTRNMPFTSLVQQTTVGFVA